MSLFGSLFPGILGGGDIQSSSELGTGGNPMSLGGNDKGQLRSLYTLPHQTSAETVQRTARDAGEAESQAVLLSHQSKWMQRRAAALVKQFETRVAHSKAMMGHEQRIAQLGASHGQAGLRHALSFGETRSHYQGYESEFQGALNTIDV